MLYSVLLSIAQMRQKNIGARKAYPHIRQASSRCLKFARLIVVLIVVAQIRKQPKRGVAPIALYFGTGEPNVSVIDHRRRADAFLALDVVFLVVVPQVLQQPEGCIAPIALVRIVTDVERAQELGIARMRPNVILQQLFRLEALVAESTEERTSGRVAVLMVLERLLAYEHLRALVARSYMLRVFRAQMSGQLVRRIVRWCGTQLAPENNVGAREANALILVHRRASSLFDRLASFVVVVAQIREQPEGRIASIALCAQKLGHLRMRPNVAFQQMLGLETLVAERAEEGAQRGVAVLVVLVGLFAHKHLRTLVACPDLIHMERLQVFGQFQRRTDFHNFALNSRAFLFRCGRFTTSALSRRSLGNFIDGLFVYLFAVGNDVQRRSVFLHGQWKIIFFIRAFNHYLVRHTAGTVRFRFDCVHDRFPVGALGDTLAQPIDTVET
uniref:Uncharacterized protein n=1 Tax=Anopheles farauti TaxID=69004 RepID=A0A182QHH6_9DIPT